jgi:hypothetical protein
VLRASNGDFLRKKVAFLASCWVTVVVEAYGVLFKHHDLITITIMMSHRI